MRTVIAGGWYCDATPTGGYAALVKDSHIDTSRGRVPLCPGGNVLFLRCADVEGTLYLAGQGHADGSAWLWDGSVWHRAVATTNGQKVVAFGPLGLYVAHTPHQLAIMDLSTGEVRYLPLAPGSGGIQYVRDDGEIVLGDQVYNGSALPHPVAEYTILRDLTIGQGYDGGALINGRMLEPGHCTFINAKRRGDDLSIALVVPGASVFHWITRAEVDRLPLPHTPPPPPKEEPTMPSIPNYLSLIEPLWAQHGGPTDDHAVAFLRASAKLLHAVDPRIGLWKKGTPWGHDPDKLVFKMAEGGVWFVDIVANAGSPSARPSWQGGIEHYYQQDDQTNWMPPLNTPPTEPTDPHAPDPLQKQLDALVKRVAALEAKPPVSIDGARIALKTAHGKYVCAEDNDRVVADRTGVGSWEVFTVEKQR